VIIHRRAQLLFLSIYIFISVYPSVLRCAPVSLPLTKHVLHLTVAIYHGAFFFNYLYSFLNGFV